MYVCPLRCARRLTNCACAWQGIPPTIIVACYHHVKMEAVCVSVRLKATKRDCVRRRRRQRYVEWTESGFSVENGQNLIMKGN